VFVFRCARHLYQRIEPWAAPEREPPTASTTKLGDWAANVVIVHRERLVLAVSYATLLPVLLPMASATTLLSRFPGVVGQTLRALGVGRHTVATEVAAMAEWTVTGPGDGRILGSVADFTRLLNTHLDGRPLLDVALRMAEVPCDRLGMARPRDETLRVFSAPHLRLVSR
jgi:hypothetical protein